MSGQLLSNYYHRGFRGPAIPRASHSPNPKEAGRPWDSQPQEKGGFHDIIILSSKNNYCQVDNLNTRTHDAGNTIRKILPVPRAIRHVYRASLFQFPPINAKINQ